MRAQLRCVRPINLFNTFGLPEYIYSDRGTGFMSKDLKDYLHLRGIATSRTTPYNPRGNGQVERYNGVVWRGISLCLASQGLDEHHWLSALPDVLHAIRSLVCTSTNQTPHERMFNYNRKSTCGSSLPSWLMTPGPVLVRRYVRKSKYDPLVDEAMLIEANPKYAHIRLQNGQEKTVSLRDLAPVGGVGLVTDTECDIGDIVEQGDSFPAFVEQSDLNEPDASPIVDSENDQDQDVPIPVVEHSEHVTNDNVIQSQPNNELVYDYISKSGRISKKPDRLGIAQ